MDSSTRNAIFGPMRAPFLILTPACVLLGTATAARSGAEINFFHIFMALVGALSAHISVNALNEYDDFNSGLDLATTPTPFSGGSGTLPDNPDKAHVALITGLGFLLVTGLVGVFFLFLRGPRLLPLGIVGMFTVVAYTRWFTKNPILCLISPGLGFGPLMVMGTDFILTGSYSITAFVASAVPFFLVSNLLLLNQFPDIEPDKRVGRRHLPIVMGKKACTVVYGMFLAFTYGVILFGCLAGILPPAGLCALATVVLAVQTLRGVARHADDILKLIPSMGKNVILVITTPVILSLGLFFGS